MDNDAGAEFCAHCGARLGPHRRVPWWHLHRRLYDWTLAWAYRPSATVSLFAISFFESIIFPVPPDVLLVPLVLGNRRKWAWYAFFCSLASVLGAVAAYVIGWLAWEQIDTFMYAWFGWAGLTEENFSKLATQVAGRDYRVWVFWAVFTAGVTPLPFKVFNIFAGMFGTSREAVNPAMFFAWFLVAAVVSRSLRFFLLSCLMRVFGPKVTPVIEKYFNWLALAFAVLLIGGFVVIKYAV
jgi:membrane protein YqaA with SNARE-associated domain